MLASYGHVRDLVPKEGAVDLKRKFAMRYQILEKNEKHVHAIARALKKSDALYLATDPDREGEAISWHLVELLKELGRARRQGRASRRVLRDHAQRDPRGDLAAAPHLAGPGERAAGARRALDYLVGFNLSPLLWKKAGLPGASAGRVQSPALRMICEREEEIARFKPREYWTVDADVEKAQQAFPARLIEFRGEKVEQFTVTSEQQAADVRAAIEAAAAARSASRRSSASSAAAIRRRRSRHRRCSRSGARSASARSARCGCAAAVRRRRFRRRRSRPHHLYAYGLGESRQRGRAGNPPGHRRQLRPGIAARIAARLQDQVEECAGSARSDPSDVRGDHAERLEGKIDADQFKLYSLIWKRAVASQMEPAVYDTVAVDLVPGRREARRRGGRAARQRLHAGEARLHRRI